MKGISSPSLGFLDTRYVNVTGDTMTGDLSLPKLNLTNASATFDDITTVNKDFTIQSTYSGEDTTVKMEFAAPEEKDILFRIWSDGEGGSFSNYLEFKVDRTFGTHLYTTSYLDFIVSDAPEEDPDTNDFIRFQTVSNVPEILTVGACDLKINAGGSNDLLLNDGGGNVGIGTDSPQGILDVSKDTDQTVYLGRAAVGSPFTDIAYFSHVDTLNTTDYAIRQNTVGATHVNSKSGQSLNFSINNTARMVIKVVNVGIGESDPQAKLHVKGSVDNEQLIVQANATQTANIQEWQASNTAVLSSISGIGHWGVGTVPLATTTFILKKTATPDGTTLSRGMNTTHNVNPSANNNTTHTAHAYLVNKQGSSTLTRSAINPTALTALNPIIQNSGTGNITKAGGLVLQTLNTGNSTITDSYGFLYTTPQITDGAITNLYGIYVEDVTGADTLNFAIYTNAGLVHFQDNVGIGANATVPSELLHVQLDQNAETKFLVKNITDDTASKATFAITTNANQRMEASIFSSSFTQSGLFKASTGVFQATGAGGFFVMASHASGVLGLGSGGLAESDVRLHIDSDGDVSIGHGNNAGTARLDVKGTADTQQLIVMAHSSQTANILEIQKSDNSVLAGFDERGILFSDGDTDASCVYIGSNAGNIASSAVDNTGVGTLSISSVTTGISNAAIGTQSLQNLTEGDGNMAVGANSLQDLTIGDSNTAIGWNSLANLIESSSNVGIGRNVGINLTSGAANVLIGAFVLDAAFTATCSSNTIIGYAAATSFTGSPNKNTIIGRDAGAILAGDSNIFIGFQAGDKATGSNLLIVDNVTRADIATEITNSILYGVMAAAPANQTLRINANVEMTEDTFWSTEGSGLITGHMNAVNGGFDVVIGDNNPTEVEDSSEDGWETGLLNGVTFPTGGTEHYLAVTKAGKYHVFWDASIALATVPASTQIHIGVAIGGSAIRDAGEAHRTVGGANVTATLAGHTIVDCPNGNEEISLWIANITNTNNVSIDHANVVITQVMGT